jgi:hypothetical protein
MTPKRDDVDLELIEAATGVAKTRCRRDNHTVACTARCGGGEIVTAAARVLDSRAALSFPATTAALNWELGAFEAQTRKYRK